MSAYCTRHLPQLTFHISFSNRVTFLATGGLPGLARFRQRLEGQETGGMSKKRRRGEVIVIAELRYPERLKDRASGGGITHWRRECHSTFRLVVIVSQSGVKMPMMGRYVRRMAATLCGIPEAFLFFCKVMLARQFALLLPAVVAHNLGKGCLLEVVPEASAANFKRVRILTDKHEYFDVIQEAI